MGVMGIGLIRVGLSRKASLMKRHWISAHSQNGNWPFLNQHLQGE